MNWSVLKAAREWGLDRETLSNRLVRAGFEVKPGATFHTREITNAIHGSLQQERIRLTRAMADIREAEKRLKEGSTITEQRARELLAEVLGPVRSLVSGLPALASRCNPAKPAVAAAVLEARAREILERTQMGRESRVEGRGKDQTSPSEGTTARMSSAAPSSTNAPRGRPVARVCPRAAKAPAQANSK